MNPKLLFYLAQALVVAPIVGHCAASIPMEAYDSKRVSQIDVVVENLPTTASANAKRILARLKTKVGDPFSQGAFDSDLKALSDEYDRVEPSLQVRGGELQIHLALWLRPQIRKIVWSGNEQMSTSTLKKELGIKPHALFNRAAFNKAFNKLKEFYVKKGYFESQLEYRTQYDAKGNGVDIQILIREGRSGTIDDIVFKGFTKKEQSQILSMIRTKRYNLFTSWFTGTGEYNEEELEHDQLVIVHYLQNQGYADAKVAIRIAQASSAGRILVTLTADRGPIYHFGRVTFAGNTLFSDQEIEKCFHIHKNQLFSPDHLQTTFDAIKELYGRKGYIEVSLQYDTVPVEHEPLYNVAFRIDEGRKFKIGLIRVLGNVQTQAHVILRESLLVPGETFDSAKLKATQKRLENMGYFKKVNVYAVRCADDESLGEGYRDVYIEVEETMTGSISLFFGFSSQDKIFGGLDLTETNFNICGIPEILRKGISAVRGAGEYAHIRVNFGTREKAYSFSWLNPYFMDTLWRAGFDLSVTQGSLQSKDYRIKTQGGTLYASYPVAQYWTYGTKYRLKHTTVRVSKNHDVTPREREELRSRGIISAIGTSVNYDSTNSAVKPHNGLRSVLEAEMAGLGGKFTFLKFDCLNNYYSELWPHGIMKYRAEFRFIKPMWKTPKSSEIPVSERFFLGGENSVRGYKPFSLGPRFENGDPAGGTSSALCSVEYLHEVFSFLDLFTFIDAGAVSGKRFTIGTVQMSYGVGARLELINHVPLILGWGYPVNPEKNQSQKFFFSLGGQF